MESHLKSEVTLQVIIIAFHLLAITFNIEIFFLLMFNVCLTLQQEQASVTASVWVKSEVCTEHLIFFLPKR